MSSSFSTIISTVAATGVNDKRVVIGNERDAKYIYLLAHPVT